ncbi:hypothetical protein IFR04_011971 [Cadophora malorum]|uniref:Cell wall protein n=1 Tax=Cadophora malorum TaxID=108018 RepID=A0A8H7W2N2_9HELO|nr:hypothetical protein IFR04_011971 [Cadophora malorum]
MHITAFLFMLNLLFTITTSCASPDPFTSHAHLQPQVQQGDISTILADISSLNTLVSSLTTTATGYSGSLAETLALASTVKQLKSALATATTDVRAEVVLQGNESKRLVSAAEDLAMGIRALLVVLGGKAPVIAEAGYTSPVSDQLKALKASTSEVFVALDGKVGVEELESVRGMQGTVGEAFERARISFSGKVGRQRNEFVGIRLGVH